MEFNWKLFLTALGLAYAGVTLGLILGYDSRALIDERFPR